MKRLWIIFLLAISPIPYGCNTDYVGKVENEYINNTEHKVLIIGYSPYDVKKRHTIMPHSTLDFSFDRAYYIRGRVEAEDAFGYARQHIGQDSTAIIFNAKKRLLYRYSKEKPCTDERTPYCVENYKVQRFGDLSFKYTYTIGDGDYKKAKDCGNCE